MDAWQSVVNAVAVAAGLAALAGLIVRKRVGRARLFAVFLALVSAYGAVVGVRPDLVVWRVWLFKELALSFVALLCALEVGVRLFARRSGARPLAGEAVLVVMALTALLLALDLSPPAAGSFAETSPMDLAAFDLARSLLPRLAYGTAWLFTMLWAVARRFRLPLDTPHEAVLLGSAVFWGLQALSLGLLHGPRYARLASDVITVAFVVVLLFWTRAAWRREPSPDASEGVIRQVWPWR